MQIWTHELISFQKVLKIEAHESHSRSDDTVFNYSIKQENETNKVTL